MLRASTNRAPDRRRSDERTSFSLAKSDDDIGLQRAMREQLRHGRAGMRVLAGSVTWIGTIATHCCQPHFDSGTMALLLDPAPLPSRSTVHWLFGATSRCSSAAETASLVQTMTCSLRDPGPPTERRKRHEQM
jgi:hypothetical protein